MPLKAILDSVEGLPEAIQSEYTKRDDGKFILNVEAVDGFGLDNAQELRQTVVNLRSEVGNLKRSIAAFGDMDPQKAAEALEKVEEMATWTPTDKVNEQIEAKVKQVQAKLEDQIAAKQKRIDLLTSKLHTVMLDDRIRAAIVSNGGDPELLMPYVKQYARVVENNDEFDVQLFEPGKDQPMISMTSKGAEPMKPDEFVKALREKDSFSAAFKVDHSSGSGSTGTSSSGGAANGRFTITEQQAREDPRAYRAIREAAEKEGKQVTVTPS